MSEYDENYSDNEVEWSEEQREIEYNKISHFTQADYMKCPQTRDILVEDFEEGFQENLEEDLRDIFINNYHTLANKFSSVLYRADESHAEDFIMLVHHHLVKNYNLGIFKEDPSLARPLVEQIDDIREREKLERNKEMNAKINKSINKQKNFVWGKQKK